MMPPADFRLYHLIGKGCSGVQYVILFLSSPRKPQDATIHRVGKPILQTKVIDKSKVSDTHTLVNEKPSCLVIVPTFDGTALIHLQMLPQTHLLKMMWAMTLLKKTRMRTCMLLNLSDADASPDKLRVRLKEALDTSSFTFRKFPALPADAAN